MFPGVQVTAGLALCLHPSDLGQVILRIVIPCFNRLYQAAANATKFLGLLKRTFSAFSKDLFIFLHKTYVRPYLEYCVQLWCLYLPQNIDTLEKVQKRATKLVRELAKIPYESRLRELRIYSLYCRRQQEDLIETYKLLKGYYDLDWTGFFTLSPVRNTRGHHHKIYRRCFTS